MLSDRHRHGDQCQAHFPVRPMRLGRYAAAAAVAVLLLSGCPEKTESTPLNVDASVPEATRQKITRVTSPLGSVDASAADTLPKLTTAGETIVLAGDSGDEVHLAAIATADDPAPKLSARSTALALVRLAQGSNLQGVSGARFNSAIQAAAEFSALERLVVAALAAGTPPISHPGVRDSVLLTLAQALQSLPAASAALGGAWGEAAVIGSTASPDGRARAMALVGPRVNGPLPYAVLPAGSTGALRVTVVDAAQAELGVLLQNGWPINFAARGTSATLPETGLPALPPDDATPHAVLPAASPTGTGLSAGVRVAVAGVGSAWNLNVYRTPGVRTRDGTELTLQLWNMPLLGLGTVGDACVQQATESLHLQTPIAAWASKSNDDGYATFRASLSATGTLRQFAELSTACLTQKLASLSAADQAKVRAFLPSLQADSLVTQFTPFVTRHMALLAHMLGLANPAARFNVSGSIAQKALLMHDYWDEARTVGVCQARDVASGLLTVASCPTTLELDRSLLELAPGAQYRYTVAAKDSAGNTVPVPAGLRFSSSRSELVGVDPATGVITVLSYSPVLSATITAVDPVSGARGDALVNTAPLVVPPPLAPTETLDFQSGAWSVGSYFQGGTTPADPVNGGFRFYRSGPLDDPFLSRSSGRYVSGMFIPTPSNVASDNYFVAVERVDGRTFDALALDVGLFDFASGSSFARPALEMVGTFPNGTVVISTASLPSYFTYGAGSQLTTIALPDNFRGLQRLTVRMKLRATVCDSCKVGLTLDNMVLR